MTTTADTTNLNTYEPLSRAKRLIREAFLDGIEMSSNLGNRIGHTVDFRKCVSRLRREGMDIRDRWEANPNDGRKFKVYYLVRDGEDEAAAADA